MHASDVTTNLLSVFLGAPLRWAGYICVSNGLHVIVSQLRSVCVISCTGNGLPVTSLECVQTVLDNSCVSENVIKL